MSLQRIQKLQTLARAEGFDCMAVMPGANITYLTGLHFHLMERPTLALIPVEGNNPALVLAVLEATKPAAGPYPIPWRLFTFADGADPAISYHAAAQVLDLAGQRIGIETLAMRVKELRLLQTAAPGAHLAAADHIFDRLRMVKDAAEIAATRRAVRITEDALHRTLDNFKVGLTEKQVAAELLINLLQGGAENLPFEPIVLAGPNTALPHAMAGDRPVQRGELLLFDFGVTVAGYASDLTRTFAVGDLSEELKRIYDLVLRANEAGRRAAGPGVSGQAVDRATRKVIVDGGYGESFTHRTGHGLGLSGHEPPYVVEDNTTPFEAGNLVTIEPGIYLPGRGGVRIEDDVLITARGAESLTTFPRELTTIG
ncbi:MAG TPA: Xaa-Pro peptidase family protein [Anaerolineae bacterium]|nr:Xaa-Pro peptidase family protein [Anaerolineae bacterium]